MKLTGDESIGLQSVFWKEFFATRFIEEVDEFWIIHFTLSMKLKSFDPASDETFKTDFKYMMLEKIIHDSYNKAFRNEGKENKQDFPKERLENWSMFLTRGPILTSVYDYSWSDTLELFTKPIVNLGHKKLTTLLFIKKCNIFTKEIAAKSESLHPNSMLRL